MTKTQLKTVGAWCIVGVVLFSVIVTPVAGDLADDQTVTDRADVDGDELRVVTSEDGSATIILVSVYEFSDSAEQAAFESLGNDSETQDELRTRFEDRMQRVAGSVESATSSDVHSGNVNVYTVGPSGNTVGVVEVQVTWDTLAVADADTITITEPFASGFEADRPVVITAPDGATVTETTPEPTGETDVDRSVAWSAGTDLSGFEVMMTVDSAGDNQSANDGTGTDSSEGSTPGFTALTGLLAVVVAASVVVFRKQAD